MAKYIDREAAFDAITDIAGKTSTRSAYEAVWKSARVLKKIPAADVMPVVHGRWEIDDFWSDNVQIAGKCAVCSEIISWFNELPNYCPNCGARMDGGEGND